MLTIDHCRRVAAGTPDPSSGEFRSAVAAVSAWLRNALDPAKRADLQNLHEALLAHGGPVKPRKPSREELSAIRREASARGLVARARGGLMRKLESSRSGFVSAAEKKPAVFDAALELIEDGEAHCVHYATESGSEGEHRKLVIVSSRFVMPPNALARECPWKSKRRQAEERI